MTFQNSVVVLPTQIHQQTIIFLHGKGSTASEFAHELFGTPSEPGSQSSLSLTLPQAFPHVKWIFPSATLRPSLRFQEEQVSQWFDMWSVETPSEKEELQKEGLEESVARISEIILEAAKEVSLDRIVLGGISQGCATAIMVLLRSGFRLGGFFGLCSWLPMVDAVEKIGRNCELAVDERKMLKTPVFLSHSLGDPVVPIANGRVLRDTLTGLGMNVAWKEYDDDDHWLNEPDGVDDMIDFFHKCFRSPSA